MASSRLCARFLGGDVVGGRSRSRITIYRADRFKPEAVAVFTVFIIVLLVRPEGIAGASLPRRV